MGQTVPGGYYADDDGKGFHDAWGRKVEEVSDKALAKAKEEHAALTPDQDELLRMQAQAQRNAQTAQEAADRAAKDAKAATVGGKKK